MEQSQSESSNLEWRSPALFSTSRALMLVVDVQEKLFPLIADHKRIGWNIGRLINGLNLLQVPILATEQYPQGLGSTVSELSQAIQKSQSQSSSALSIPSKIS